MTEHYDLRILGRLATAEQQQPAKDPDHDQVEQANRHEPRSCPILLIRPNCRSQHLRRVLKRYSRIAARGASLPQTRPGSASAASWTPGHRRLRRQGAVTLTTANGPMCFFIPRRFA